GSVFRGDEINCPVCTAIVVVIHQESNISTTRDNDPAARVEGHTDDVIGQSAAGKFGDFETGREAQTGDGLLRGPRRKGQENEEEGSEKLRKVRPPHTDSPLPRLQKPDGFSRTIWRGRGVGGEGSAW